MATHIARLAFRKTVSANDEREPASVSSSPAKSRARTVFIASSVAALLVGLGFYGYGYGIEATDNAQIESPVVYVASRVAGRVGRVRVKDNQAVNAGDVLVELEHEEYDARLKGALGKLAAARASLGSARAHLGLTEKDTQAGLQEARAGVSQAGSVLQSTRSSADHANANLSAAKARLQLARIELDRAKNLFERRIIANAELQTKQAAYDAAKAGFDQARAEVMQARSNILASRDSVERARGSMVRAEANPLALDAARAAVELAAAEVSQAEANVDLARLDRTDTVIRAPCRGIVSRRTVEVGQLTNSERPLLAVVCTDDVWVVANFKESQIGEMRPRMPATIKIDAYSGVTLHGHVESISGASGARFALIPPDNASGNFIKVVQRVPVRIRLDGGVPVTLRPGLSADVRVSLLR